MCLLQTIKLYTSIYLIYIYIVIRPMFSTKALLLQQACQRRHCEDISTNWYPPREDQFEEVVTIKTQFTSTYQVPLFCGLCATKKGYKRHNIISTYCINVFRSSDSPLRGSILWSTEAISNHTTSYILILTYMYVSKTCKYTSSIPIHM